MNDFLTTPEVAKLLRLKERKIYDMAAAGGIPCTRVTGKLLFSRAQITAWLARNSSGGHDLITSMPTPLFTGSHDPLLEWAIRQSECGIASMFDGSSDGLHRVQDNRATVAAVHLYDREQDKWNTPSVRDKFADHPIVLCEWVWRSRGLVYRPSDPIETPAAIVGRRVAGRQPGAGSQILLEQLLETNNLDKASIEFIAPARSEADTVLSVLEGEADCALGLESLALQHNLGFAQLMEEPLDLLIDRRFWFEPAMQQFLQFCRGESFVSRVKQLPGYRLRRPLRIRFNGAA